MKAAGICWLLWVVLGAACMVAIACGGEGNDNLGTSSKDGPLRVVTTTALLADFVKNVGGDWVKVSSIVPPGANVHSFQTTPDDSVAISEAQMIVSNGFGLDAFLEPVLRSAMKADTVYVIAAQGLESTLTKEPLGTNNGAKDDQDHELDSDPHFWQNPVFVLHYVNNIRDGLVSADPDHVTEYQKNADIYSAALRGLDREIAEILGQVRPKLRHLVTFHDSFSHFASHYGWRSSAFVASDADEVSPAVVVEILDKINSDSLPAIFVEPQLRTDVVRQAARDSGVVVGTINSDLSDSSPATYLEMMRSNARSLANHLK